MTKAEKLLILKLSLGEFLLTAHARTRMNERLVSEFDIICAAKNLQNIKHQAENNTYLVTGVDDFKKTLSISAAVRDDVLIVTVFYVEEDQK